MRRLRVRGRVHRLVPGQPVQSVRVEGKDEELVPWFVRLFGPLFSWQWVVI